MKSSLILLFAATNAIPFPGFLGNLASCFAGNGVCAKSATELLDVAKTGPDILSAVEKVKAEMSAHTNEIRANQHIMDESEVEWRQYRIESLGESLEEHRDKITSASKVNEWYAGIRHREKKKLATISE